MAFSQILSEIALADAFDAMFDFVLANPGVIVGAPEFSYILTLKQLDEVNRVCAAVGWPIVNCRGIHIDVNAIQHPIDSRRRKDRISDADIRAIVRKAYSPRSIIRENRIPDYAQQALIFNTHQKIVIGRTSYYGMAIVEIRTDGARTYLAPVTCYHATEAKVRAIR